MGQAEKKELPEGFRRVYLCEDSPEGVFCAVYDAWADKIPEDKKELRTEGMETYSLFCDYVKVQTDPGKASKVAGSVCRKICREAYDRIYQAALSEKPEKADQIYRFLRLAFRVGRRSLAMYGEKPVWDVFALARGVEKEAHLFTGFLRFSQEPGGILVGKLSPKNQVLPIVGAHFANRFPEENWAILDTKRDYGIFHKKGGAMMMAPVEKADYETLWGVGKKDGYEKLWRTFFDSIAIPQRENPRCQRSLCPLRYRDYMLEFH